MKKGLKELMKLIQSNQVERIVVNYRDRLIRFGMELVEQICECHGTEIEVINHTEDKTYEQELVEDMLSIMAVFSSRLYGNRSHKQKRIKEKIEDILKE
ncbi:IS607 family transposase [Ectobacillus funiculus]|uniref:IS607 family transposase n=1 Tax=Ectobacillus funiculus TaxID=137993 RepID=A0ABV5WH52_9BACI